jgi:predicted ATPase/tRNA A-37 threonylcarbamoyl transferase component Bud32
MGPVLPSATVSTVEPLAWTRLREEQGRATIEKCAASNAEATEARRRLRNHYLVTFGLECAGVARPLGLSSEKSGLVLALPWIPGVNLSDYVRARCGSGDGAALPAEEALDLACKIAIVLAELASQGVVHRRLCAEHVVVEPGGGKVSLLSFGLSRFMRGMSFAVADEIADHSVDLIALGRLLYWLSTGRDLPSELSQASVEQAVANAPSAVRDPLERLLRAGSTGGYWHAAAAAEDLRRPRARRADGASPPSLGAPPDLVMANRRLGRKRGADALLAAYEAVAGLSSRGGAKRSMLVVLEGRAGVGKTTLALEACRAIARLGARVEYGKFNQFGDARPMSALLSALDGVIGQILEENEDQRAPLVARICEALDQLAQVIVDVIPRLARLLGPQRVPPTLSGEAGRVRFELLLRRFVGALATPERPLVLFLDDLQWADQASLDLLRGVLRESSVGRLLIIGAHRTEAVPLGHRLRTMLDTMAADGADLSKMVVSPWTRRDVDRFLDDLKIAADADRSKLAATLFKVASGNPLGVLMALRGAQDAGCLDFDPGLGLWRANVEIAGAELAESTIIDLVRRQLARLPAACCDMVATCTLFGASFDLESVAAGVDKPPQDVLHLLWPALAHGLLIADDDPQPFTIARLRAQHDIVQQGAYLTIGEERSRELHGAIGRSMLDAYTADQTLNARVFEVVQQLNKAESGGFSEDERWTLIELNATAGRQARGTGAMSAAFDHYTMALRFVTENDWTRRPEAVFDLKLNAAEAAYLAAEFLELDCLLGELETLALRPLDAARLQELRIQSLVARNRLAEALEVGQRALALLESSLVPLRDPSEWPPLPSLAELMVGLPSDERVDTILRILVWLTPCAYITSFEMYARVILSMMELALAHPFSPLTPLCFTNYGLTLCGVGRNKEGFRAGQLALALTENVEEVSLACKVHTLTYGFLEHWSRPARQSLQPMLDTVRESLLCGDQEYVGYASFLYCDKAWGIEPLARLEPTLTLQTGVVEHFGHDFSWRHCQVWLQFVHTLMGRSSAPLALIGEVFDMRVDIAKLEAANNRFSLFTAQVLIGILCWHRGDWAAALAQCRNANQYASTSVATLLSVDHVMFWCLCELHGYASLQGGEREEKLKWLDGLIERLRGWAQDAPDNVAHKLALVEAERARAVADLELARRRFLFALQCAASADFLHDRALIEERTSDFYDSVGEKRLARELRLRARRNYRNWGSVSIAEAMNARYGLSLEDDP